MAKKPYQDRERTSDPRVVEARLRHDMSYARRVVDETYIKAVAADLLRTAEWETYSAANLVADIENHLRALAERDRNKQAADFFRGIASAK